MMKREGKAVVVPGLRVCIGLGALAGLIGGFLLGVRDSITIIFDYGRIRPLPLSQMLSFSIYPIVLYALIGCLAVTAGGIVMTMLIRAGGYTVNKGRLAGLYAGIFTLLVVSLVGSDIVGLEKIADKPSIVGEISLVSMLCGIAVGGLIVYILDKTRKDRLIALCVSLSISLLVFVYMGLWMSINLLPGFLKPISLLSSISLLMLISLLAIGLYLLSLSILRRDRHKAKKERQAAFSLLGAVAFVFIVVSLIVNLRSQNIAKSKAKNASVTSKSEKLADLKDKPNILWIVMDTVKADHLSCYGYHRETTPNIDRIASEGILFENAISAAPWTLPSHASMFTGMFPSKHGADGEHLYLADDFYTIAELLRSYGYRTFGYSNNIYAGPDANLNQGFDTYEVTWLGKSDDKTHKKELADFLLVNRFIGHIENLTGTEDAGASKTNRVVENWIADCYNAKEPFFVFINYMEAHSPHGDTPNSGRFLKNPGTARRIEQVEGLQYAYIAGKVQMSDEDFEISRTLYDGDIAYLDYRIDGLLDYLRKLGILDNTVLIITSDHGENLGEHKLAGHMLCVYDTLLHVPLIIRYPKLFPAGVRVQEQVQTVDIFPTILDILGIDESRAKEIQGYSLFPKKAQQRKTPFAIAEHAVFIFALDNFRKFAPSFDSSVLVRRLRTIRTDEFKYIWASDGRDELYAREDPGELNNLIETQPEKAKELETLLNNWLDSFEHYRHRPHRERSTFPTQAMSQ